MPIVTLPIEATKDSIMRPIMSDITAQLNQKMGFDPNLPIFYPDEAGVIMQHNSKMHKDNNFGSKLPADELISIQVDEEFDESTMDTPVMHTEYMPVFRDDPLQILITPIYMPCILNISYTYRCKDRHQAEMWRNKMRSKMSYWGDLNHHNLKYHYVIPLECLAILEEIHTLRENVAPYHESLYEYYRNHFSVRLTRISNLIGSQTRFAIAENQTRVFGHYEFSVAPDRGEKGDISTWTSTFNYKVRYSRPTQIKMQYPIMIHQQPLPVPFIPKAEDKMYEMGLGGERHFSLSGIRMEMFTNQETRRRRVVNNGISIPDYDEWIPDNDYKFSTMQRMFDALLSLESAETGVIASLKEIPYVEFSDEMHEFISKESKYLTTYGESVFFVGLFNQWSLLHKAYYKVNEDLDVVTKQKLDLRNMYHLRMNIMSNWLTLSQNAIDRLRKYPNIVRDLLIYLGFDYYRFLKELTTYHNKYYRANIENARVYQNTTDGNANRDKHGNLDIDINKSEYTRFKDPYKDDDGVNDNGSGKGVITTGGDTPIYNNTPWKEIPKWVMHIIIHLTAGKKPEGGGVFTVEEFWIEAYRYEDYPNESIHYN